MRPYQMMIETVAPYMSQPRGVDSSQFGLVWSWLGAADLPDAGCYVGNDAFHAAGISRFCHGDLTFCCDRNLRSVCRVSIYACWDTEKKNPKVVVVLRR